MLKDQIDLTLPQNICFQRPGENDNFHRGIVIGYLKGLGDGVFEEDCFLITRGLVPASWVLAMFPNPDRGDDPDEDPPSFRLCTVCGQRQADKRRKEALCNQCAEQFFANPTSSPESHV